MPQAAAVMVQLISQSGLLKALIALGANHGGSFVQHESA